MKVTRVETVYWNARDDAPCWPHWVWLRLYTDNGLVGLGETYPRNEVEAAAIRIAQAMEPYQPMWLEDMLLPDNFAQYRELAGATRLRLCMTEAYQLPIVPRTAAGPWLFHASTHLITACTNVWIQESCQRYWEHDWPKMLENPIIPKNGVVRVPELPGFGMQVKPEVWKHPRAVIRTSER